MKTHEIQIQTNVFNAVETPTTQEDNYGHIYRRFDLFHKLHNENNGNETSMPKGRLVQYLNGESAYFDGMIRFDFQKEEVQITIIRNS